MAGGKGEGLYLAPTLIISAGRGEEGRDVVVLGGVTTRVPGDASYDAGGSGGSDDSCTRRR